MGWGGKCRERTRGGTRTPCYRRTRRPPRTERLSTRSRNDSPLEVVWRRLRRRTAAIDTFNATGIGTESNRRVQSGTVGVRDVAVSMRDSGCAGAVPGSPLPAPYPEDFPRYPQSWYAVCASSALPRGAVRRTAPVRAFAGAVSRPGRAGRCAGGTLPTPGHRSGRRAAWWMTPSSVPTIAFASIGRAFADRMICATPHIPSRSASAPSSCFWGPKPPSRSRRSGMPALISAAPFKWRVNTQWYMIGANGFDARHLPFAHGRRLVAEPKLRAPSRYSLEISLRIRHRRPWLA